MAWGPQRRCSDIHAPQAGPLPLRAWAMGAGSFLRHVTWTMPRQPLPSSPGRALGPPMRPSVPPSLLPSAGSRPARACWLPRPLTGWAAGKPVQGARHLGVCAPKAGLMQVGPTLTSSPVFDVIMKAALSMERACSPSAWPTSSLGNGVRRAPQDSSLVRTEPVCKADRCVPRVAEQALPVAAPPPGPLADLTGGGQKPPFICLSRW